MLLLLLSTALLTSTGCKRGGTNGNGDEEPPLTIEEIDVACARITSCLPPAKESPGECALAALARPATGRRLTPEWLECLAEAGNDCEAVDRCAPQVSGDPCGDMPQGTTCQEDILISCFGGNQEFVTDCAAWGLECATVSGTAQCRGTGQSCLEGDESCDGATAVMCLGYREERFDCGALIEDRVCVEDSDLAECVPETLECDPTDFSGSCEGNAVLFCSAGGLATRVDCTSIGFSGCVEEANRAICGEAAESGE